MNDILFKKIFNFSSNYFIGSSAVFLDTHTQVILIFIVIWTAIFTERRATTLALLFLSTGTAWLISHLLKSLFQVTRPFAELGLTPLVYMTDYSFPSEHATIFSAVAVTMFFIDKKVGIFLGVLAVAVGLSRILIGVHYPFDIVCGFLVGFVVSFIYMKLFKKYKPLEKLDLKLQ